MPPSQFDDRRRRRFPHASHGTRAIVVTFAVILGLVIGQAQLSQAAPQDAHRAADRAEIGNALRLTGPARKIGPATTRSVDSVGVAGRWTSVFADDFDRSSVDPAKWSTCYPHGDRTGCSSGE